MSLDPWGLPWPRLSGPPPPLWHLARHGLLLRRSPVRKAGSHSSASACPSDLLGRCPALRPQCDPPTLARAPGAVVSIFPWKQIDRNLQAEEKEAEGGDKVKDDGRFSHE